MARIRTIKPDFFRHEELYQAEIDTGLPLRVAFAGMFTVADREGRFKWKPKQLKFDVLPYDDVDFESVMTALCNYDFMRRYCVNGKDYGFIPSFKDHQAINNKEGKSLLPEPTAVEKTRISRVPDATCVEGKEGKGREQTKAVADAVCEIFGKKYTLPEERLPAEANWYRTIDTQIDKILDVWSVEKAIKQVRAYIKHCNDTKRKRIATDYKVAETLLSVDWMAINAPEQVPRNPYTDAEVDRNLWTDEVWRETYKKQIASDEGFRKHFQITQ